MTPGNAEFRDILLQADCPQPQLAETQLGQLEQFLDTLLLWNERVALVSQRDIRSIACKHFVDSLVVATQCAETERVVDLGSGAGFPGLVIAIARPDSQVCLIESRAKKVSFLLEVRRVCGLGNVRVVHGRIEDVNRGSEGRLHTLAVSRALSGLQALLALAVPLLRPGGRLIAMKGPGFQAEMDPRAYETAAVSLDEAVRYQLPDGSARALVMFHVEHQRTSEPG